ncbi:bifunctional 4-hydroxy-2-oxoglutarate aldolase/2-dehydro-3-deoxy-phosphogluconate aldolase [Spiroplasma clarkii]|uniref:2-dehydro-3-deoxyphosphogluconate aldolase / (4S)-4-hydroxy-2-oxoglutarate aldolase n=1 Tax=Spiroplasma clarkii TaxID=2139 RepID=A0A2K8KHK2_9MOLU|nr:bifunctional 4-hydroxy-2-oxoglutarate aldolase/2-dehydro-3-deoxy-phosphogluconate aldolase [Spiroplasma clarkii]ATX71168.1 2-dehydro-3-deoxyphosphogluconate aldolase / (4S)-4-hydroxy-2-oxoglutarate aldolase [Spiroplasma clarkii]
MKNILESINQNKIIAVVRHKNYEEAKKMCLGCIEGGIKIIEITLTVNNAFELISEMVNLFPEIIFGAGTILTLADAKQEIKNGAEFLISSNTNLEILNWTAENQHLYIPGVMTINEIEFARSKGSQIQKLFPGDVLKPGFVKSVLAPMPDVKLIPSGGVDIKNAKEWLNNGVFAISVGGNLVGKINETINQDEVKQRSIKFLEAIN